MQPHPMDWPDQNSCLVPQTQTQNLLTASSRQGVLSPGCPQGTAQVQLIPSVPSLHLPDPLENPGVISLPPPFPQPGGSSAPLSAHSFRLCSSHSALPPSTKPFLDSFLDIFRVFWLICLRSFPLTSTQKSEVQCLHPEQNFIPASPIAL